MEKGEYRAYFFTQWENVIADFNKMAADNPGDIENMNRWYKARAFRWSSISESERMILDDLKQPEFAGQLRQALNNFKFTKEETGTVASAGPMLALSAAAGAALGAVLKTVFHSGWFLTIAGGILLTVIGIWFSLDRRSAAEAKRDKQLYGRYTAQLREYTKTLEQVFIKYDIK